MGPRDVGQFQLVVGDGEVVGGFRPLESGVTRPTLDHPEEVTGPARRYRVADRRPLVLFGDCVIAAQAAKRDPGRHQEAYAASYQSVHDGPVVLQSHEDVRENTRMNLGGDTPAVKVQLVAPTAVRVHPCIPIDQPAGYEPVL